MTLQDKIKNLTWWNEIVKLKDILTDLSGNTFSVGEAPVDGFQYGRQDAGWTKVESGGSGGSQDLQSVLDNNPEAVNKTIILTQDLDDTNWSQYGYSELSITNVNSGIEKSVRITGSDLTFSSVDSGTPVYQNQIITNTSNSTFLKFPAKSGEFTIATEDWVTSLLDDNRNQGVQTLTLNGVDSVFTIAHGLGVVPSFAFAGRGSSLNFDVFNTTWDATNIIITYQNPPIPGTLNINWIALK